MRPQLSSLAVWLIVLKACLHLPLLVHGRGRSLVATAPTPSPTPPTTAASRPVFREYIGGGGAALTDVPVTNASVEFHFILAFAIDENGGPTNGNFTPFWQPRLSPANVKAIKATYNNVKVSLSIGGGGTTAIFQPTSVTSWLQNAVTSLSAIISEYFLDGIDIDYEIFDSSTADDFAACIGELITQLKNQKLITTASIAPYPATDSYYTQLWSKYNASIDYVNYQFYSQGDVSVSEYLSIYEGAKGMYAGGKVLPSFETLNNGTAIVPSSGLDGCKKIKEEGDLLGIFIWSADQSYKDFQYEIQAQSLLAS